MQIPPSQPDDQHLSVDDLVVYLGRLASERARKTMERHLLRCAECRARVVATTRALADTEPQSESNPRPALPPTWH